MSTDEHKIAIMEGVREYAENAPVELWLVNGRRTIRAFNQGGYDCTDVDLQDLLDWLKQNGQLT